MPSVSQCQLKLLMILAVLVLTFSGLSLYTQYQLLSEENKKTMDDSHHDSHHEDTIYSSTGLQFTITDYCFCQDYNYLTVAFQAHQKIRNFAMPYQ